MINNIPSYINSFIKLTNPELEHLEKEHNVRSDIIPCIGKETGYFISWLIHITKATNILEFGTCIGFSAIFLAEAVKKNKGHVTSIELSKKHYEEAKINLEKAKLSKFITLINGDASEIIEQLEGPFDLILQDSQKALYPKMLEQCINKVKQNGIIIADDTLFKPMGKRGKISDPIHEYNILAFNDPRLFSIILPIGDGLTLSIKI